MWYVDDTGLVAKSIGRVVLPDQTADQAAQQAAERNCLYEVSWAVYNPAPPLQLSTVTTNTFVINPKDETRSTATALMAVQLAIMNGQSISATVSSESSGVSGLLRSAAREQPTLGASLHSTDKENSKSMVGCTYLQLKGQSSEPLPSSTYSDREGVLWRPQLVQSSAPVVRGTTSPHPGTNKHLALLIKRFPVQ